jgi:hypothetical protein
MRKFSSLSGVLAVPARQRQWTALNRGLLVWAAAATIGFVASGGPQVCEPMTSGISPV